MDATPVAEPRRETFWRRNKSGILLYLAIAIAMALLLSVDYIVKHHAFAFVDIGSDTFLQFLPFQIAEARQLRDLHTLTWSFDLGLGAYIGLVFYPIELLGAFFPDSWQLGLRLPIYLSQLVLGGAFFFAYLRKLDFEPRLCVFGALAYAFSSYSMINGQWDPYPIQIVQFAAYLYFIEAFLRGGNRWHAVGAGLTVGLGHVFDIYTFSLLTLIYVTARPLFANKERNRTYPLTFLRYAGWAALGFLLTAPIQFPALHYFFDNPRVSGTRSAVPQLLGMIWQLNDRGTIGSEIAGFFGKDLLGTGNAYKGWGNYFEAPGFYVGLLLLLCIPQLLGPNTTRREKWLCAAGIVLTAAYVIWPALRFAVNGFGHTAFRVSTLWVSCGLLILGLAGLRRMLASGLWRAGLLIGAAGLLIILFAIVGLLPQIVNVMDVVRIAAFVLVYSAMLWFLDDTSLRAWAVPMLLPVFACELLLFAAPAMIDRTPVNSDDSSQAGSYLDGTQQALAFIRQREGDGAPFYRVEKTYNSVFLCDALFQNYHGIKSYFFHGSSITRFIDSMHLQRPVAGNASYIGSAVERPKILDLLGVKYLLARDRSLDGGPGYTFVGSADGVNIYRNDDARGFAQLFDSLTSESDTDHMTDAQRDTTLLDSVVLQDPAPIRGALQRSNAATSRGASSLPPFASVKLENDTTIVGTAHASTASVLLLSMPYDPGWSATLDGVAVTTARVDYGLTGMVVPPGLHELALHYVPPGRRPGEWAALAALGLLMAISATRRNRRDAKPMRRMLQR